MTTPRLHIAVELLEAIGEYLDSIGYSATDFYQQSGFHPDDENDSGYVDFALFS